MMNYTIEINNFEGPLDLLLHLIKESEVDICDINIEEITSQYLEYINKMEALNLNVASEYLVMAAELIEIKSSTLLPKRKVETEDDYEEDPREILINRLLEYERYKNITSSLKEFELERGKVFSKEPYDLTDVTNYNKEIDESFKMEDLVEAFNKLLARKQIDKPLNTKITSKEYSIFERSNQIKSILKLKRKISFVDLFDNIEKDYIVITFLSILDMAKHGEIDIKQDNNFGDIVLEIKESD